MLLRAFRICALAGVLAVTGAVSAAMSETLDELLDIYFEEMSAIADAVETVEDDATARQAAVVIQASSDRLEQLSDQYENHFNNTTGAMAFANRQQEFMAVQTRLSNSMMKLMSRPELMQSVSEAMNSLPRPGG